MSREICVLRSGPKIFHRERDSDQYTDKLNLKDQLHTTSQRGHRPHSLNGHTACIQCTARPLIMKGGAVYGFSIRGVTWPSVLRDPEAAGLLLFCLSKPS